MRARSTGMNRLFLPQLRFMAAHLRGGARPPFREVNEHASLVPARCNWPSFHPESLPQPPRDIWPAARHAIGPFLPPELREAPPPTGVRTVGRPTSASATSRNDLRYSHQGDEAGQRAALAASTLSQQLAEDAMAAKARQWEAVVASYRGGLHSARPRAAASGSTAQDHLVEQAKHAAQQIAQQQARQPQRSTPTPSPGSQQQQQPQPARASRIGGSHSMRTPIAASHTCCCAASTCTTSHASAGTGGGRGAVGGRLWTDSASERGEHLNPRPPQEISGTFASPRLQPGYSREDSPSAALSAMLMAEAPNAAGATYTAFSPATEHVSRPSTAVSVQHTTDEDTDGDGDEDDEDDEGDADDDNDEDDEDDEQEELMDELPPLKDESERSSFTHSSASSVPPLPPESIRFAWAHPQRLLEGLAMGEYSWGRAEQRALERYVQRYVASLEPPKPGEALPGDDDVDVGDGVRRGVLQQLSLGPTAAPPAVLVDEAIRNGKYAPPRPAGVMPTGANPAAGQLEEAPTPAMVAPAQPPAWVKRLAMGPAEKRRREDAAALRAFLRAEAETQAGIRHRPSPRRRRKRSAGSTRGGKAKQGGYHPPGSDGREDDFREDVGLAALIAQLMSDVEQGHVLSHDRMTLLRGMALAEEVTHGKLLSTSELSTLQLAEDMWRDAAGEALATLHSGRLGYEMQLLKDKYSSIRKIQKRDQAVDILLGQAEAMAEAEHKQTLRTWRRMRETRKDLASWRKDLATEFSGAVKTLSSKGMDPELLRTRPDLMPTFLEAISHPEAPAPFSLKYGKKPKARPADVMMGSADTAVVVQLLPVDESTRTDGNVDEEATAATQRLMGSAADSNSKSYMEDRVVVCLIPHGSKGRDDSSGKADPHLTASLPTIFGAVYDGHCGEACAAYASKHLHGTLASRTEFMEGDIGSALAAAFEQTSDQFLASAAADDSSGSTAVVAVVMDNTLHVANAGDSRAVISRSGVGSSLTTDHKPEDEGEYNRIVTRGGVYDEDFGGVKSPAGDQYLKCSRSLGDRAYKQGEPSAHLITAEPDVFRVDLDGSEDFCVLASDGVWDVISNQKACDVIAAALAEADRDEMGDSIYGDECNVAAKALVDAAVHAGSEDNLCAAVIRLAGRTAAHSARVIPPSVAAASPAAAAATPPTVAPVPPAAATTLPSAPSTTKPRAPAKRRPAGAAPPRYSFFRSTAARQVAATVPSNLRHALIARAEADSKHITNSIGAKMARIEEARAARAWADALEEKGVPADKWKTSRATAVVDNLVYPYRPKRHGKGDDCASGVEPASSRHRTSRTAVFHSQKTSFQRLADEKEAEKKLKTREAAMRVAAKVAKAAAEEAETQRAMRDKRVARSVARSITISTVERAVVWHREQEMLALLSEHAQQAESNEPPQDATGGIYWDADSGQWHPVLPPPSPSPAPERASPPPAAPPPRPPPTPPSTSATPSATKSVQLRPTSLPLQASTQRPIITSTPPFDLAKRTAASVAAATAAREEAALAAAVSHTADLQSSIFEQATTAVGIVTESFQGAIDSSPAGLRRVVRTPTTEVNTEVEENIKLVASIHPVDVLHSESSGQRWRVTLRLPECV